MIMAVTRGVPMHSLFNQRTGDSMRIKFYVSDHHACGHIRGEIVAREIQRQYPNIDMDVKCDVMISDFIRTNIMVFQRPSHVGSIVKMGLARKQGIKVVYDVDDDFFATPKEFTGPWEYYSKPEIQANIATAVEASDIVFCSTLPLAQAWRERFPKKNFMVVKNAIDIDRNEEAYIKRKAGKREGITIGWMASGSHAATDTRILGDALDRIMDEHPEVKVHFIGLVNEKIFNGAEKTTYKDRIKCENWVDINALPYAMSDFDISLAVIEDNPYNRAKSNIKVLHAGVLGIPTVASNLCVYGDFRDGHDIAFAKTNDEEGFYQALKRLVTDAELRKNIGNNIRDTVVTKWDIRKNVEHWAKAYLHVYRL